MNQNRNLTDQEIVRRQKMQELRDNGIDPFGQRFERTTNALEIHSRYQDYTKEQLEEMQVKVAVAGRIMTKRGKGKAGFMHIQDRGGQIQIYVRKDQLTELEFEIFDKGDLGDIVGIEGILFRTNVGELSIKATKYTHLTKALRPLPEKYHGLQDKEEARRRRYVDLIMNSESRRIAFLRPKIIRAFQKFFDGRGFVEVETPILHPILGGANARPFITHHNTLDMDFYLRIATELPLKKLIVGGMEAVYEIGRLFRNEGMDSTHNPEFTSVEAYLAYSDMEGMMDLVEDCLRFVALDSIGTTKLTYQGYDIDLGTPFKRVHMVDAIKEQTGIDFFKINDLDEAIKIAEEHDIQLTLYQKAFGHIINLFFEKYVEETLIQPTFIMDTQLKLVHLRKRIHTIPALQIDSNCLFVKEYANAFAELNDPIDQLERFENQLKEKI